MIGNRNEIARMQSDFYREKYYKYLRRFIYMSCIIVVLIAVVIYFVLFQKTSGYYATTTTGQIIPMLPKG